MRSIITTLVGLSVSVLVASAAVPWASSPPFDPEKDLGRWVTLWNTYDLDLVDELFLEDDHVTYFSSEKKGLIRGIEAVREHHRGFGFVPGGKVPSSELWLEDLQTDDFGDTAVVTAIWFFGDRKKAENQHGPMTAVYVRVGGGFRIAHLNFSHY